MLQKQMFRSFRLSWRHFDVQKNIWKPSTVICNAILNKNFCTVEPNNNKTREISAPEITEITLHRIFPWFWYPI